MRLFPRARIFRAADEFFLGDWLNKRIHDSHGDTTPRPIYFPDEFHFTEDELHHVMQQMHEITRHVALLLQPQAKPYTESVFAFELFGCDFMITDRQVAGEPHATRA